MAQKTSKCYKNGHAGRGWQHLRHAQEQKRPAQGEQRNKQGEARCATGTCGMGVGWRPWCLGHWRCVSGFLKRRTMLLPCRLAQWRQALTRPRCAMSLELGQQQSDQHIRINPVRPFFPPYPIGNQMPITREKLVQAFALAQIELARIVVLENQHFADVGQFLDHRYDGQWRQHGWLLMQDRSVATQFKREIFSRIERIVRQYNHHLYQAICVNLNWCQNRNHPTVEHAEYIAAALDIFGTNGAAALTVLLIKRKFLDKLCNCGPQQ